RVPASYCGVFGFRPTWGRVPLDGVMALAGSYDTAGVFAQDASHLRTAATALLGRARRAVAPAETIVVPEDVWALADPHAGAALMLAVERTGMRAEHVDLAGSSGGLETWADAFRTIQGAEAWATYGEWVSRRRPSFGPGIAARFEAASRVTPEAVRKALPVRARAAERVRSLTEGHRTLVIPSACGVAPLLAADTTARRDVRERTLRMTCIAGHAGAPVASLPLATLGGFPLGLSLIGAPGEDEEVLDLAVAMCRTGDILS
ncbi:MAG TPA: amidase family protein, partial [Acidimicrobiales bacterium]|nr:amidase family protein [Acidimicrobiales bacterium]